MINLKDLLQKKDSYIEAFKSKNLNLENDVTKVIRLYNEYASLSREEQILRESLNKINTEIKNKPKNEPLDPLKIKEAKNLSTKSKDLSLKIMNLNEEIKNISSYFPNVPNKKVPNGKGEEDNVVLYSELDNKKTNNFSKPHWNIIEEKNLILSKEASLISGPRQIIYNDKAALIIKALEKFMLEENSKNGFVVIEPPVIVNKAALYNTSQLPKFEDDLFKLNNDQYLIPTAEVPLTNLVANKILEKDCLPIKYTAGTNCFRKEAGSAGKDTRGLIRLHQFRKVELVMIGNPNEEEKDFDFMLETAKNILNKLELPYRVVQLCTGDLSFGAKETQDIEVWMPGVNMYREISSVSSMGDFQSRRMKARFSNEDKTKTFVYTYNGSSLAIGRTFAAIIENYIQEDGSIIVPNVLKKYLPFDKF